MKIYFVGVLGADKIMSALNYEILNRINAYFVFSYRENRIHVCPGIC